ncbi:MAG: GNAT family N-acetyltransferase [Clostridia bacterium]|nr:GNAT family N-acetyltransferase [Clostridia bacterium]
MEIKIIDEKNINVVIINDNNEEVAKATCFIENTPKKDGQNVGTIGEIEIKDYKVAKILLEKCEEILKSKGITYVVAPMNGNSWKKYRTLKKSSNELPFILENVDPIELNQILLDENYNEIHTYTSTKGALNDAFDGAVLKTIEEKVNNEKIVLRDFRKFDYEADLRKIYNISIQSFVRNPLYTPISEVEFIKQYEPYINMIDENLILIAEKDEKEVGFVFCIPNFNEIKNKGNIESVILKTIAVLPEYQNLSLGNLMLNKIAKIAKNKGYKDWIYAFMYSHNTSQRMATRNKTKVIREYALYGKEI